MSSVLHCLGSYVLFCIASLCSSQACTISHSRRYLFEVPAAIGATAVERSVVQELKCQRKQQGILDVALLLPGHVARSISLRKLGTESALFAVATEDAFAAWSFLLLLLIARLRHALGMHVTRIFEILPMCSARYIWVHGSGDLKCMLNQCIQEVSTKHGAIEYHKGNPVIRQSTSFVVGIAGEPLRCDCKRAPTMGGTSEGWGASIQYRLARSEFRLEASETWPRSCSPKGNGHRYIPQACQYIGRENCRGAYFQFCAPYVETFGCRSGP